MLLKRILARYKEKNVLSSDATQNVFRRSRSLKRATPRRRQAQGNARGRPKKALFIN